MKKACVVVLLFGLIVPLLPFDPALAQVRVQRLWVTESANLDDRGRPLSDCAGQYRMDPGAPPRARMRGACESGDPAVVGVPLTLQHINNDTGAVTIIGTFTIDAVRGATFDFRTPANGVPVATTDNDVILVVGPDGVVMTGGWELP